MFVMQPMRCNENTIKAIVFTLKQMKVLKKDTKRSLMSNKLFFYLYISTTNKI